MCSWAVTHATFSLAKNGIDAFSGEVVLEEKKSESTLESRSLTCIRPLISAVQLHLERSFFYLAFFYYHTTLYSGIKYKEVLVWEKINREERH